MAKNSLNKWLSRYSKKQKLIFGLLGTATLALVALLVWLGVTGRLGISASTTGRVYFTAQTGTSPQNTEVPKTWRTSAVKVTLSQAEFEAMGYPNTSGENSDAYKTYFDKDKHVWHISITSDPRYNSNSKDKWGYFVIQSLNSKEEVLNQITDNYYAISNIIDFPVVRGAKYARVQYHTKDGKFLPWWKIDVSKINPNEKTNDANLGKYDDSQVPRNFVGRRCLPGSGQIAVFSSADYSASRINSYDIELGYERACEILPAGNYVNLDTTKYPADFGYLTSNGGPYSSPIHTRSGEQVYGNSYPMNDAISSILVKNATVQVYKNASYSGDSKSINSNTASFDGTGFNDTISSLKVVSTVPPPPTCMLSSDPTTIDVTQGASASTTVKAAGGTVPTKANTEIKVWSGMGPGTTLYTKNDFTVDSSSWPKLTISAGSTLAVGLYTVEVIDKTNACTSVPILVSVGAQCQLVATPNKLNIGYMKSGTVTISANQALNPNDIQAMIVSDSFEFTPSITVEKSGDLKYEVTSLEGSEGKTATVLFADNRNVASKCGQVTVPVAVGDIPSLTIEPTSLPITVIPYINSKAYTVKNIVLGTNKTRVSIDDNKLVTLGYKAPEKWGDSGFISVTAKPEAVKKVAKVTVQDDLGRSASATLTVDVCRDDQTRNNDGECVCAGENEEEVNGRCECIDGYKEAIDGTCVPVEVPVECPGDLVPDPMHKGLCKCPDGFIPVPGFPTICQIVCPPGGKVQSEDRKSCVCPPDNPYAVGDNCLRGLSSNFTADPNKIEKGQKSTLRWEINNITSTTNCTITGPSTYPVTITQEQIAAGTASGSKEVSPIATSEYKLECSDPGRPTIIQNVTVTVNQITTCPVGQRLVDGECVPIVCPDGEILDGNNCVCPAGETRGEDGQCQAPGICAPGQTADMAPTGVWEIKTLPVYAKTDGLTLDKYLGLGILNYFFDGFTNRYGLGEEGLAENFTGGIGHWRKNKNSLGYICLNVEENIPTGSIVRELPHKALNMVGNPYLDKDKSVESIKFKFSSTGDREISWNEAIERGLLKAAFVWSHTNNSYLSYTNLSLYPEFTRYGYQDFSTFSNTMPHNGMWISTRSTDTVTIIF